MKRFGPDDHDGLKMLQRELPDWEIDFISADQNGWAITERRIQHDMGYRLHLIPEEDRAPAFARLWPNAAQDVIFIGDGMFDAPLLQSCFYGIAPRDAAPIARAMAVYVTQSLGGNRAVAKACLHIIQTAKEDGW